LRGYKICIIIAAIIITVGLVFLGLSNRFYIDSSTKLKVDRLTGKTYQLINGSWKEIKDNDTLESTENTESKQSTEIREIEKVDKSLINNEYKNNVMILKTNKSMHEKFCEYYRGVLDEYNKDRLFTKNNYTLGDLRFEKDFKKYSPYLSPKYIVEKITKDGINDPDEF